MEAMAKHRSHSVAFKRQGPQEFLAGQTLHGLANCHIRPASLSITHISRAPFAPVESGVILSVTPIRGGVTDERGHGGQHLRLAGSRSSFGGVAGQAPGAQVALPA